MRYGDGGGVGPQQRARRELVRLHAARMFDAGVSVPQVAAELEISPKSAYAWRRAWKAGGEQALASRGAPGPDPLLSEAQVQKLIDRLEQGPAAAGWDDDQRWTLARVRTLIGRKGFGEDHFADLLDAVHQHLGAPIALVWDGLPAHKSAKMRALIAGRPWLHVYQLPGYAPELNPVENMWSSLKRSMANLALGDIDDLLRVAKNRLKRMQYRSTLAIGFLATSGLAPP
ncbi:transposase [Micromonospora sp. DT31]|uniref:transposase n=1 Tax=Micromonospora sp. DT31 TaxID=3393434 RepID=UPI003CFAFCE3